MIEKKPIPDSETDDERRANISSTLTRLVADLEGGGPINWKWLSAEFENLASYAREDHR